VFGSSLGWTKAAPGGKKSAKFAERVMVENNAGQRTWPLRGGSGGKRAAQYRRVTPWFTGASKVEVTPGNLSTLREEIRRIVQA